MKQYFIGPRPDETEQYIGTSVRHSQLHMACWDIIIFFLMNIDKRNSHE